MGKGARVQRDGICTRTNARAVPTIDDDAGERAHGGHAAREGRFAHLTRENYDAGPTAFGSTCSITQLPSGILRARFGADMRCSVSISVAIRAALPPPLVDC